MKRPDGFKLFLILCLVSCIFSFKNDRDIVHSSTDYKGDDHNGDHEATVDDQVRPSRMIGGKWAKYRQFPYHASILVDGEFRCGGSLISTSSVLTAAHCFFDDSGTFNAYNMKILLDRTALYENQPSTMVAEVVKVYVPKIFSRTSWGGIHINGDIAVLKLRETLDIPSKRLATLPKKNNTYVGKKAIATGQGVNSRKITNPHYPPGFGSRDTRDGRLRFDKLKVLSNTDCSKYWDGKNIPASSICAKTENKNSGSLCNGDSGGPLVYNQTVIGVLSFGSRMCQNDVPVVFTRVSSYADFIDKATNDKKDPNICTYNLQYYYTYNFNSALY